MNHLGRRLSALVDGELNHARRDRALSHLAQCEACRREAVAMRALKHRMRTLDEATVAAALTDRLVALAAGVPPPGSVGRRRGATAVARRWRGSRLVLGALAVLAVAVPAFGFLAAAGTPGRQPRPSVSPAVDLFVEQHAVRNPVYAGGHAGHPAGSHFSLTATTAPAPSGSMGRLARQDR
jgi:anti-sigma factor RsiW